MSTSAVESIKHASVGFDFVFQNDLNAAKNHLSSGDSPFHLMGLGCVVFLQAALGMEPNLMTEASRLLGQAETKAKREAKAAKSAASQTRRFSPGLEYEVLQADAIMLTGLTQALSETYTGYLQCIYSMNSAHTKFMKIYKIVFPDGVDNLPSITPNPSLFNAPQSTDPSPTPPTPPTSSNAWPRLFNRSPKPSAPTILSSPQLHGAIEELIISGSAFGSIMSRIAAFGTENPFMVLGFGLFNLVLSLLPARVRSLVGFLGFNSDRRSALDALEVAAGRDDVHAVFAGFALMSYHGAVLSLSGYQANEEQILGQYREIVDRLEKKFPSGSLWILHKAKILRMTCDLDTASSVLDAGLSPERPHSFLQADALLVFELAWTQLAQRRYREAADTFIRMTELNAWSHATYYFIAAGCHISLGNVDRAQGLLDQIPALLDKRKLGGRDLPTEVFIRKKIAFYKRKQVRKGGSEASYAESIRISPAEELGIFWNIHNRITTSTAEAHVRDWLSLSPPSTLATPYKSQTVSDESSLAPDLDTSDELAVRSLLLGVVHRSLAFFVEARAFLENVATHDVEAKWIRAISYFELAVLRLKEAHVSITYDDENDDAYEPWMAALREAERLLDRASELSGNTDLSSRLDSRISLMRCEIAMKKDKLRPIAKN